MRIAIIIACSLFLGVGCAAGQAIEMDGFTLEKAKTEELLGKLERRAVYDLGCPGPELKYTILAVHDDAGADMPKQVGVNGCDRWATYTMEFFPSRYGPGNSETGWRMDVTGVQAAR